MAKKKAATKAEPQGVKEVTIYRYTYTYNRQQKQIVTEKLKAVELDYCFIVKEKNGFETTVAKSRINDVDFARYQYETYSLEMTERDYTKRIVEKKQVFADALRKDLEAVENEISELEEIVQDRA